MPCLPDPVGWELASSTSARFSPASAARLLWAKPGLKPGRVKNGEAGACPEEATAWKGLVLLGAKMGASVPRKVADGWDGDQEGFGQEEAGSLNFAPVGEPGLGAIDS